MVSALVTDNAREFTHVVVSVPNYNISFLTPGLKCSKSSGDAQDSIQTKAPMKTLSNINFQSAMLNVQKCQILIPDMATTIPSICTQHQLVGKVHMYKCVKRNLAQIGQKY